MYNVRQKQPLYRKLDFEEPQAMDDSVINTSDTSENNSEICTEHTRADQNKTDEIYTIHSNENASDELNESNRRWNFKGSEQDEHSTDSVSENSTIMKINEPITSRRQLFMEKRTQHDSHMKRKRSEKQEYINHSKRPRPKERTKNKKGKERPSKKDKKIRRDTKNKLEMNMEETQETNEGLLVEYVTDQK